MPIRPDSKRGGKTALCINCPDTMLNMVNSRFTLHPDNGFGESQPVRMFVAFCTTCGYTELYQDGYYFSSNETPASKK